MAQFQISDDFRNGYFEFTFGNGGYLKVDPVTGVTTAPQTSATGAQRQGTYPGWRRQRLQAQVQLNFGTQGKADYKKTNAGTGRL